MENESGAYWKSKFEMMWGCQQSLIRQDLLHTASPFPSSLNSPQGKLAWMFNQIWPQPFDIWVKHAVLLWEQKLVLDDINWDGGVDGDGEISWVHRGSLATTPYYHSLCYLHYMLELTWARAQICKRNLQLARHFDSTVPGNYFFCQSLSVVRKFWPNVNISLAGGGK